MTKSRMEAFSDGVIAILITIMVLELGTPHGTQLSDLAPLVPVFVSYVLSFVNIGIYWNNHHNLLQAAKHVDGAVLWANMHLLFWLSLVPFATAWMGENGFPPVAVATYGFVLLMCAVAFTLLVLALVAHEGRQSSTIAQAIGRDLKGRVSLVAYVVGTVVALAVPAMALAIYVAVAVLWFVPDRRFERQVVHEPHDHADHAAGA
ncbi:MAG TPA: TMEM175 family protein [Candidatus Limnocylindrales bacterium]|jgi:uncharacterized membrane protein